MTAVHVSRVAPSAPPLELWDDEDELAASLPFAVASTAPPGSSYATDMSQEPATPNARSGVGAAPPFVADRERNRVAAAGVAAGAIGLLLGGGPVIALIVGGGTAYAAARRRDGGDDVAGDVARAVGDVALTVRDKARDIDRKHRVVHRSRAAARTALVQARGAYARSDVTDKTKGAITKAYRGAAAYERDHRILEKAVVSVRRLFRLLWSQVQGSISARDAAATNATTEREKHIIRAVVH